jgi:hypothetical protein
MGLDMMHNEFDRAYRSDYAVSVEPALPGGWRWTLIDIDGRPAASGQEGSQQRAFRTAMAAAASASGRRGG